MFGKEYWYRICCKNHEEEAEKGLASWRFDRRNNPRGKHFAQDETWRGYLPPRRLWNHCRLHIGLGAVSVKNFKYSSLFVICFKCRCICTFRARLFSPSVRRQRISYRFDFERSRKHFCNVDKVFIVSMMLGLLALKVMFEINSFRSFTCFIYLHTCRHIVTQSINSSHFFAIRS